MVLGQVVTDVTFFTLQAHVAYLGKLLSSGNADNNLLDAMRYAQSP